MASRVNAGIGVDLTAFRFDKTGAKVTAFVSVNVHCINPLTVTQKAVLITALQAALERVKNERVF